MKQILSITLVALAMNVTAAHADNSDATNTITAHVQAGLFAEEVNHDFATATAAYESAIAQFDELRPLAATALFRLAETHRRAGRTEEAEALYKRIVREFHDHPELATLAAEHLPNGAPEAAPATDTEAAEIAQLKELFQESPDLLYARQENGRTRLYNAIVEGKLQVVKFLISRGFDLSLMAQRGEDPLTLAVEEGHQAIVEFLLEEGKDVNSKSSTGYTPLHSAAVKGFLSIAKVLLENGADVNAKREDGRTPLYDAILFDKLQRFSLVQLLIDHGADVNAGTTRKFSPLHLAADGGNVRIAELLLKHSADVNAQTSDGATPLHIAVSSGRDLSVPMAELLLKHGADVNVLNSMGKSPLDVVPEGSEQLADLLRQHGGTEGKFHATISIIAPFKEQRVVLWDRSEEMTLRQALEKADIVINNIAYVRVGVDVFQANPLHTLEQDLNFDIKNGTEITLYLNPQ